MDTDLYDMPMTLSSSLQNDAGERVISSVTKFIEKQLKLVVNEEKKIK
nr:hypothetical protein [Staphylococcus pseudintermedius]